MRNDYEKLEIEIIEFESDDIVTASGNFGDQDEIDGD